MLERTRGLTGRQLAAIAALEREVVAADGGRLKLEWAVLRSRSADEVRDLLWWQGDRLLGFLGVYGYRPGSRELAGMVAPDARRRGIGSALLEAAREPRANCEPGGPSQTLLVVPRNHAGGREFALAHGASLEHSEHALVLTGSPPEQSGGGAVGLRQAVAADRRLMSELFNDGFGRPLDEDSPLTLHSERAQALIIEGDTESVGTISVTIDGGLGRIHGFVVASDVRGRGIGRRALAQACRLLRDRGAASVSLEVEVDNERALGLYTSVGFRLQLTEDYYELPVQA